MPGPERFYFEIYDVYLDDPVMAGLVDVSGPYLDDAVVVQVTQEPTSELINSALRQWSAFHPSQGKAIPGSGGLHDLGQLRYARRLGIRVPGCDLTKNPEEPPSTERARRLPKSQARDREKRKAGWKRVPRTEAGRRANEIREQNRKRGGRGKEYE